MSLRGLLEELEEDVLGDEPANPAGDLEFAEFALVAAIESAKTQAAAASTRRFDCRQHVVFGPMISPSPSTSTLVPKPAIIRYGARSSPRRNSLCLHQHFNYTEVTGIDLMPYSAPAGFKIFYTVVQEE